MVRSDTIQKDLNELVDSFNSYMKQIEGLAADWKGISYDSISSKASEFYKEYQNTIIDEMNSFSSACDLYEIYTKTKSNLELANTDLANLDADDEVAIDNLKGQINTLENSLADLKNRIESELEKARSKSLVASSSGNTNNAVTGVNTSTKGDKDSLGATSGTLPNARIGDEGRPDYSGFYLSTDDGGFNPFPLNGGGGGEGGNCTYYAYSRFSELMGEEASTLSHGDACSWWSDSSGYKKGQEPRLGAIAVWQYGDSDSMGHVAIVESIDEDGNITTSQGGWSNCSWYNNETYYSENGYATGYNDGHLLGFIYPEKED